MKFFHLLTLFFLLTFFACQPDNEIDTPNDSLRNKIIDTWHVNETSQIYNKSSKSIYTVEIIKDSDSTKVLIDNFYNLGYGKQAKVIVNDDYTLSIPQQDVDGFIISGSGNIDHGLKQIDLSYITDDQGGLIDTVSAAYTR
ncbi:MAG TPA: hypothetical protein EYP69_01170 [Bacteroidales bacterium]|nr:hypothetical protein [Bacteroidales bacterium]